MRSVRLVQAVALMMIVAIAASCAATREYSSKLFTPRNPVEKENKATALRFLDVDSSEMDNDNWVSTDLIMGRDTITKSLALDNFSKMIPASPVNTIQKDSSIAQPSKTEPTIIASKSTTESAPVARYLGAGEVRSKKTRDEK
jgi:hypothetical protein